MKKVLLNLVLVFSLFGLLGCGGPNKDPKVAEEIVTIVQQIVDYYNVPKNEIKITYGTDPMTMTKKEQELAKNIKIEVIDVLSVDDFIDYRIKELEKVYKKREEQRGNDPFYVSKTLPTKEELKEKYKKRNIESFYKYSVQADVVVFEDEIIMNGVPDLEAGRKMINIEADSLKEENLSNLKYETVEAFGYVGYVSENKQLIFISTGIPGVLGGEGINQYSVLYNSLYDFLRARWKNITIKN